MDQACVDAVYHSPDEGKAALIERMESRHGIHTVEAAAEMGLGSREYTLVNYMYTIIKVIIGFMPFSILFGLQKWDSFVALSLDSPFLLPG